MVSCSNSSTETDYGPDYIPLGLSSFDRELKYGDMTKKVSAIIPIPLPEYSDVQEFFAYIVATQDVWEPFHDELLKELSSFIRCEKSRLEDKRDDAIVERMISEKNDLASEWSRIFDEQDEKPSRPASCVFGDYFQFIMKNSSPERLVLLINKEIEMADEMRALIRARDWELDSLRKECENMLTTTEGADTHPHNLSRLNEKMRQVHGSYACQIEGLSERQRRDYHKIVEGVYERDEIPIDLLEGTNGDGVLIPRSISLAHQPSIMEEHPLDESFTIYLGAQLKTMHNARILSRYKPLNGPLGGDVSTRLHAAMSLYRRSLSAVILLVEKHPLWHTQERTDLARCCEQSTELHFDSLPKQLEQVQKSTLNANQWRMEQSMILRLRELEGESQSQPIDTDIQREEGSLLIGDVYTTTHSNLDTFQVVYHLVADQILRTDDINSRHPCLNGLRNIIRLCARFGVTSINIPLLLVDEANETMTVSWCVRRAELVFKCVKGYLMEICGSGWGTSSPLSSSISHSPHYNINFVLPAGLAPSVHTQIGSMFPSIFHLVPSKTA